MGEGSDLNKKIAELVTKLQQGDLSAGNKIVRLMEKQLIIKLRQKVPSKHLNDIYQETWLRFFNSLQNPRKIDSYIAWFLSIARIVMREMLRKEKKTTAMDDNIVSMIPANISTVDQAAYGEQLYRKLRHCLNTIPKRYSTFLRGYVQGKDRGRLCEQISLNPDNFSRFLHRARKRLLACMGTGPDGLEYP